MARVENSVKKCDKDKNMLKTIARTPVHVTGAVSQTCHTTTPPPPPPPPLLQPPMQSGIRMRRWQAKEIRRAVIDGQLWLEM